jgi:glycosyltransferase involved in cell wall biosynthesis
VVIPAYNAGNTMVECLASIAAQTLKPVQIVVVDDYSHDATGATVRDCGQFLADVGIELEYIRLDRNAGPSAARNAGLRRARGSYVAFLDADDVWAREKLAIVDSYIIDAAPGLVCHGYSDRSSFSIPLIAHERKAESLSIFRMLLRNPAQTSCAVIRRDIALEFDERMRYCEDHDLWMRIAERYPVLRIVGTPLTRLGRPQLSAGGLSEDTLRMRIGEMRVYYNFCRRAWARRFWLLPGLALFSLTKHVYSKFRRWRLRKKMHA